jgi:ABC-type transporter Mla subunit MlaD
VRWSSTFREPDAVFETVPSFAISRLFAIRPQPRSPTRRRAVDRRSSTAVSAHTMGAVATLENHEARIAALEASQADYRAVLAAVNALAANQRDHALDLGAVKTDLAAVKTDVAAVKTDLAAFKTDFAAVKTDLAAFKTETRASFRSVDEHLAEIRDLIIDRRNRP